MISILNTVIIENGARYIIEFYLENEKAAKYVEASYLGVVRMLEPSAELYSKKNVLYLDTCDKKSAEYIGNRLRNSIEITDIPF